MGEFKILSYKEESDLSNEEKEKYLNLGFDDYLSKPTMREELQRVLNKVK